MSERKHFIYFDVPKCASTTIRKSLLEGDNSYSMADPQAGLDEYYKFTFVRNPWDRMVSNWKMFTTWPLRIEQLKSMTSADLSDFGDFVRFAQTTRNHHWLPQALYLPEPLDFVGRVETFAEDFAAVCRTIGEDPRQPGKFNVIPREPYWTYYTPELADLVAEMYSDEIKSFGFEFDTGRR